MTAQLFNDTETDQVAGKLCVMQSLDEGSRRIDLQTRGRWGSSTFQA